jgi:hypothetical protein
MYTYRHGLIEVTALGNFAGRHPIRIGRVPTESLHGEDIVRRARSRLGERCYDVLENNCEHFCSWCQVGESRSTQVDLLLQQMRRVMRFVRNLLPLGQVARIVGKLRGGVHALRGDVTTQ